MKKLTADQKLNILAITTGIIALSLMSAWFYVATHTIHTANKEIICGYDKTHPYECVKP